MIEISQINNKVSKDYVNKLRYLINSNIELSDEALEYYNSIWTMAYINNKIDDYVLLMATINNEIKGVLVGTSPEGGVATIIWVLVDNNYQKNGLGSLLFDSAKRIYKKMDAHKIKLTVPEIKTVNFYKKQGMIMEGVHKNHWFKSDFWSMGMTI